MNNSPHDQMNSSPLDRIAKLPVFLIWSNHIKERERERGRERAISDQLTFILLKIIFFFSVVSFIQEPIKNLSVKEYRG
jgi:hypothetical protein